MAVRQATNEFADLASFLKSYEDQISKASLFFEAGALGPDIANEFKLDLIVPLIGRQGPIPAQVVHRGPDGSIGVHLPEMPGPVDDAFKKLFGFVGEVRDYLVASSQFVSRGDYNAAVKRLARAETSLAAAGEAGGRGPKRAGRGIPIPDTSSLAAVLEGPMSDRSLRDAMG